MRDHWLHLRGYLAVGVACIPGATAYSILKHGGYDSLLLVVAVVLLNLIPSVWAWNRFGPPDDRLWWYR